MNNEIDVVNIRLVKDKTLYSNQQIHTSEDVIKIFAEELRQYDREVVAVINLQTDGKPININIVSIGTIDQALVSPAQIFKSAILTNANAIILLHNHPSGQCNASPADKKITKRLVQCGQLMGIELLDHIVVGDELFSFAQQGYISEYHNQDIFNEVGVAIKEAAFSQQEAKIQINITESLAK